jgi:hypothetical protein
VDACKEEGQDAIEADNVGIINGFSLSYASHMFRKLFTISQALITFGSHTSESMGYAHEII